MATWVAVTVVVPGEVAEMVAPEMVAIVGLLDV